jgi:GH24 family phage-related lysozyme (muramidase)
MDLPTAAAETAVFEGFRATPYKDIRGFWTFGEGRCLETSPLTGPEWKYLLDSGLISVMITHLGAKHLTEERLLAVDADLRRRVAAYPALPDPVRTILCEMAYQIGAGGLLGFVTFMALVSKQQYAAAAADGRTTRWYQETPVRAEALMKRLEAVR